MEKRSSSIGEFIEFLMASFITSVITALPAWLIWNGCGLYTVFHCERMTYWQALGFTIFIHLVKPLAAKVGRVEEKKVTTKEEPVIENNEMR